MVSKSLAFWDMAMGFIYITNFIIYITNFISKKIQAVSYDGIKLLRVSIILL